MCSIRIERPRKSTMLNEILYPPIEPYRTGFLPVGDDHQLYWKNVVVLKAYQFYSFMVDLDILVQKIIGVFMIPNITVSYFLTNVVLEIIPCLNQKQ